MGILLHFTKDEIQPVAEQVIFGEESAKSYLLQEYAGWHGVALVGENSSESFIVSSNDQHFMVADGVFTSFDVENPSCDIDDVLKEISGHYLIVQQKFGESVSIVTDSMLSIPAYIYKIEDSITISTRLDWLLMQVNKKWNVSWEQVFSFVLNSSYAGRRIFVDDVSLADFGSIYSFSKSGDFLSNQYWQPPFASNQGPSLVDYRDVADTLVHSVRESMDNHTKVVVPITGGVDSRLVLAAALKVDRNKVVTLTHGFAGSKHPDVILATKLAEAASVPHTFLESNENIKDTLKDTESTRFLHKITGGQARHNFVYDLMMYDRFDELGCDLELKGLAGGLFKAKWHTNSPTAKITDRFTKKFRHLFGGKAKLALTGLDQTFMNISNLDRPSDVENSQALDWLSFAVRFSNRIAPRTSFQINRFASFNPFYDRSFLNSYLTIPAKERQNALIHLKMIQYLAPELTDVPYLFSNKYYMFKDNEPCLIEDADLKRMGLKKFKKRVSRIQYIYKQMMRKIGVDDLISGPPVPADWEYIKEPFLEHLKPVLKRAKSIFPNELGNIDINDFRNDPVLDSRSYRLYSILNFITYCDSYGTSFE